MKITLEQIQRVHGQTQAGMSDCKRALEECNGDEAKAARWCLYKGIAVSAKRFWDLVNNGLNVDKGEPVMTIENGRIPLLGCDQKTFFGYAEKALAEIATPRTPEVVKTAVDNVIQGLAPKMFLGMPAKLAREAGMSGIPAEVPDSAYLSHDGITCNVKPGEDGKLNIVMTFETPCWTRIDIQIKDKVAWLDSKGIQRNGTVVKPFPAKTPFVDLPASAANDDQEDLFHRVNRLCDYSFHDRFIVETAEGVFAAPKAYRLKVVMRAL